MIPTVRAAAFAVAAFAFAGAALLGGPVQAQVLGVPASVAAFAQSVGLADEAHSVQPAERRSLDELVVDYAAAETDGAEQDCLANAVYFEARGEALQGQLAVAEVVMNRAASGRYPASLCAVIVQHAQFSFVRHGHIPQADHGSEAWRRAVGVARVAVEGMAPRLLPTNCLWYHADYVSPSWGQRLAETTQIGRHIFYS